jgi:hypothetical protein
VDGKILFVHNASGTQKFYTCDNAGGTVTAITLDWSSTTLLDLSNPRRAWGDTVFFFIADDSTLTYFMKTGINGVGTIAKITSDGTPPAPQLGYGVGIYSNKRDFILTVDEFTLGLIVDINLVVTFALFNNESFVDWSKELGTDPTVGYDFTSYFVSGYKLRGEGIRKFQTNYIELWNNTVDQASYYSFRGLFDYTINLTLKRVTTAQSIAFDKSTDFSRRARRLKIRGHGKVLQFRVDSVSKKAFNIEGWATFDTANQRP